MRTSSQRSQPTAIASSDGGRLRLEAGALLTIGRSPGSSFPLSHSAVSWNHAEVSLVQGEVRVRDLGSVNGTWIDDRRIEPNVWHRVDPDAVLRVGGTRFQLCKAEEREGAASGSRLLVGRSESCDLIVSSASASRIHCELQASGDAWIVRDLDSTNGTFLNGQPIAEAVARRGDLLRVGSADVECHGAGWRVREQHGIRIDCVKVRVQIGSAVLVHDVTFSVLPGQVLAVVGPSGAGKSTLLSAMCGIRSPSDGHVFYNGLSVSESSEALRSSIGFVPQDDIVHRELKVQDVLAYEARLRLPDDATEQDIEERVDQVLTDLGLQTRRDARVRELSGGERKRVNIAVELLTNPPVLFLDEPTAGLDPALEGRVMDLLSALAGRGRTIVLITHSPESIARCDRVLFLAPGGHLAFVGRPAEAIDYFGCSSPLDIYSRLAADPDGRDWGRRFAGSQEYSSGVLGLIRKGRREMAPRDSRGIRARAPSHSPLEQFGVLTRRVVSVLAGDWRYLLLLFLQAPLIGAVLGVTFSSQSFNVDAALEKGRHPLGYAPAILMMLALVAVWCGVCNAAREIVKESALYRRARRVYLQPLPYMLSKIFVLAVLAAGQTALLLWVMGRLIPLHAGSDVMLQAFLFLWLASLAATLLGLALSAVVKTSDQAMSLLPLAIIPQVIFAGVLLPLDDASGLPRALMDLSLSRWCTGALCKLLEMQGRHQAAGFVQPDREIFNTSLGQASAALIAACLVFFASALLALRRQEQPGSS